MATFAFSTMAPPQGATFIFGSWVCVTNGSGGFDSHLTNPPALKIITSEDSSKLADELAESLTWGASYRCLPPSLLRDTLSSMVCR